MLAVITLMWRILFSPLWILWKVYNGLWWAFDDSDRTPRAPKLVAPHADSLKFPGHNAQNTAFEVVDSRPPRPQAIPRPVAALRGGFVGSILSSLMFYILAQTGVRHDILSPSMVPMLWIWCSSIVFVGSLWVVKHVARREAARPRGVFGHVRAGVGGLKDAAVEAGSWAAAAPSRLKRVVASCRPTPSSPASSATENPAESAPKRESWRRAHRAFACARDHVNSALTPQRINSMRQSVQIVARRAGEAAQYVAGRGPLKRAGETGTGQAAA